MIITDHIGFLGGTQTNSGKTEGRSSFSTLSLEIGDLLYEVSTFAPAIWDLFSTPGDVNCRTIHCISKVSVPSLCHFPCAAEPKPRPYHPQEP